MKFFFLFTLALWMVIRPFIPVLEYDLNYEYISKVLCENRAQPQKKCNGKCHLKKNLRDVFDDESRSSSSTSGKSNPTSESEFIYFQRLQSFDFRFLVENTVPMPNPFGIDLYAFEYYKELFHPPAFEVSTWFK